MTAATDVYDAIAHPARRQVMDVLRDGPRRVNDLAGAFAMSRPAVSQHLRVLREAGLVGETRVGRERHYHLNAAPLRAVNEWTTQYRTFWEGRLDELGRVLDRR
ncbi:MAG TPA: metalloregulator ArsR/SmtB family transcription factor [Acidothermaceae bacterium]|nr:metalloregulator ArsR/SmtB family transcription factor [Acidothermaceae bacterium]